MKHNLTFTGKNIELSLDDCAQIQPIAHALSTELRLKILCLIVNHGMSINEIARALEVPVSTVALNVQVLESAGLISCELQPGIRGTLKLCSRRLDSVSLQLWKKERHLIAWQEYDMPVGCYSRVGGIQPTCGFASYDCNFAMDDSPAAFFHPVHFQADILWMREGYVEYNFPAVERPENVEFLEFSFEACSEAPGYRNDWPSDINISVNGVEIGIWRCPGDFGGRRGRLNPEWWPETNTQYGMLTTWRISHYGSLLDNEPISRVTRNDLGLRKSDCTTLRIGVGKSSECAGGMNLFGNRFGDHAQSIRMRCIGKSVTE